MDVELREYLRMLRRGWLTIVLVTILGVALSLLYVIVTPKKYVATSAVIISPTGAQTLAELQQGQQYAVSAAASYAQLIESPTVLKTVARRVGEDVGAVQDVVTASSQQTTAIIFIQVRIGYAAEAADIANFTAQAAASVIPALVAATGSHAPLITVQEYRPAGIPSAPVTPNASRITLIGFAVGLALGLALAIARQTLDTKLRSLEDVTAVTKIPVLAVIPRLIGKQRTGVVVRDFPQSPVGETFRSLRTNLARLESGERRSIACTGVAHDHEGAQTALNLAWSFANVGWHVLFIDLDLRSTPNTGDNPGAAGILAGDIEWRDAVSRTSQEHLDVMAAGRALEDPSDLLGGRRTPQLLRSVEAEYDYVVVHVPPLLTYTDAAVVARAAGHTLVTVSARRTRSADLTNAVGVLRNVQIEPVGLVLAGTRAFSTEIIPFHSGRFRGASGASGVPERARHSVAQSNGTHP